MTTVTRLDDLLDGHPLGPRIPFVAVDGDVEVATGDLMAKSWMGDETGRLVNVRWQPGRVDAAAMIVEAATASARPGTVLNAATNAEVHPDPAERIALFESCGFEPWQEKEGFWWRDEGRELPEPDRITARTLAQVGSERFARLIETCSADTLDRIDADAMASMGPSAWSAAFLAACDDSTWLLAEDTEGQAVGLVSVGEFDEGVGTITYIAVAPDHRGRGYVDQLLRLANRTARERGFTGMLSDTDVLNVPMMEAFRRNGHSPEARAWHKWMHRRKV
ncbi:GNAT family N-acetyltransferase [Streptacidiphilus rugosus]|uniref:GNAT family N-acetyltransferase n=1 Tax=Streptacidiphilus rugosus TaxID=405783 RepID=UPI000567879F|nr:GNAT family N-acetyltransferase [Streptacidiphilus rugosus]